MRSRRFLIVIAISIAVVFIANALEFGGRGRAISTSYQAVVCPKGENGTSINYSLPNKKVLIRGVGSKKVKLFKAGQLQVSGQNSAAYIEAQGVSILGVVTKPGNWAGGVLCTAPRDSQWFAGGNADISSKGRIVLVNSGLSTATVEIYALSDNAGPVKKTVNVKSNSISEISLVGLTPGSTATAVKVSLITGRVSAFMFDERGKGLSTLGGDVVNGQTDLVKDLVIPAIPVDSNTKLPAILRVGNPGASDANISAQLISKDGNFVPVGLNATKVSAGRAANIDIPITQPSNYFGLRITSSEPIVASVYNKAKVGKSYDFVWSTAVNQLQRGQWAVYGLKGKLIVAADNINVYLDAIFKSGETKRIHLTGSDIKTWKLPSDLKSIEIRSAAKNNYAALLITDKNGSGVIPLIPGSTLTRSTLPTANISVLNP